MKIDVKLSATVCWDEESGVFVSHCPILNVYSQAETEVEAKEALAGAVMLHDAALKYTYQAGGRLARIRRSPK